MNATIGQGVEYKVNGRTMFGVLVAISGELATVRTIGVTESVPMAQVRRTLLSEKHDNIGH
jgi:hypothetical protein